MQRLSLRRGEPTEDMRQAWGERVAQYFTVERIVEQTEGLYRQLLDRKGLES